MNLLLCALIMCLLCYLRFISSFAPFTSLVVQIINAIKYGGYFCNTFKCKLSLIYIWFWIDLPLNNCNTLFFLSPIHLFFSGFFFPWKFLIFLMFLTFVEVVSFFTNFTQKVCSNWHSYCSIMAFFFCRRWFRCSLCEISPFEQPEFFHKAISLKVLSFSWSNSLRCATFFTFLKK